MRFTIDIDKTKKIILIFFISLLVTYLMVRSIILIIDYNERNKPRIEETKKYNT